MTKREQILSALTTKLKTLTTIQSSKVFRSRQNPYTSKNFPFVTIEPVLDNFDQNNISFTDSELEINISVFQSGTVPDTAVDPILEEIWTSLYVDFVKNNSTLNEFVQDLRFRNLDFEFEDGERPFVKATYALAMKYRNIEI